MFALAFLPMLIFTPMAYELSFQDNLLAIFMGFMGVIGPAVIIAILVRHYRKRLAMAQLASLQQVVEDPRSAVLLFGQNRLNPFYSFSSQSVTAPNDAEVTALAYLASTPRV